MALMVLKHTPWGDVVSDEPMLAPGSFAVLERIESLEAEARADAAHESDLARREGYEAGLREGREESVRRLARFALDADTQARALERYVIRAIDVALVSVFGELPREVALPAMIGRVLASVDMPGRLTLRVSRKDLAYAEAALAGPGVDRTHVLRVIPDDSLPVGACVIESEAGCIDAGLEVQLRGLREALADSAIGAGIPDRGDGQTG